MMTISDVTLRSSPRTTRSLSYRKFGKRVFDVLFTLAAAPLILPLILLFAVLIRRDGGDVFFKQQRVGKNGMSFSCLKLRTMVPDAEAALAHMCETDPVRAEEWLKYQKLTKDPRITRIGRILRKTSLDELPQFWNVFVGDMSIVGPRPFMPDQQELYTNDMSAAYFQLRPGITGPWQVSARNETTFSGRVKFDEEYLSTLSLANDVKLVFQTVGVVLKSKGN